MLIHTILILLIANEIFLNILVWLGRGSNVVVYSAQFLKIIYSASYWRAQLCSVYKDEREAEYFFLSNHEVARSMFFRSVQMKGCVSIW